MKIVGSKEIDAVLSESRTIGRLRKNLNIHDSLDEPLHKLVNALQPGTVLPVHRHLHPPKKETIVLLQGCVIMEKYNDQKQLVASYELSRKSGNIICEIFPDEWHTYRVLEKDTLILGIKLGPYVPYNDIDVLK